MSNALLLQHLQSTAALGASPVMIYSDHPLEYHFRNVIRYHQTSCRLSPDLLHAYPRGTLITVEAFFRDGENTKVTDNLLYAAYTSKRQGALWQQLAFPLGISMLHGDDNILGRSHQVHSAPHTFYHLAGDLPVGNVTVIGHFHRPQHRQVYLARAYHAKG